MIGLDDLDLFPSPDRPRPGAAPARKCRRHIWMRAPLKNSEIGGPPMCARCGIFRDDTKSRRGRNNRSRGGRDELAVARLLGGSKVGPLGLPHDVEVPGYLRIQCKRLDRWPSLARVLQWLDAIPPHDDIRAVSVADTPGPGIKTRRLLIVDLDEFARWHGRSGPTEVGD